VRWRTGPGRCGRNHSGCGPKILIPIRHDIGFPSYDWSRGDDFLRGGMVDIVLGWVAAAARRMTDSGVRMMLSGAVLPAP